MTPKQNNKVRLERIGDDNIFNFNDYIDTHIHDIFKLMYQGILTKDNSSIYEGETYKTEIKQDIDIKNITKNDVRYVTEQMKLSITKRIVGQGWSVINFTQKVGIENIIGSENQNIVYVQNLIRFREGKPKGIIQKLTQLYKDYIGYGKL